MIDTDKYEGHTPGPWKIYYDKWERTGWWIDSIARGDVGEYGDTVCQLHGTAQNKDPTSKLIADAPLLLAEVKRLREMVMLLDARLGTIYNHALGLEDWEQAQASILAECRGEVPHEIHPYPPLDMKNNR